MEPDLARALSVPPTPRGLEVQPELLPAGGRQTPVQLREHGSLETVAFGLQGCRARLSMPA